MTKTIFRVVIFLAAVCFLMPKPDVFAQDSLGTAMKKGRVLLSLSSSTDAINYYDNSINSKAIGGQTGFDLKTDAHFFLRDNFSLGGRLELTRGETQNYVSNEEETFKVSMVFRRYFSKVSNGGLYPEVTVTYGRNIFNTQFLQPPSPINQSFQGNLLGGGVGVGFTYLVKQHFGIDVGLSYSFYRVFGETVDHVIDTTTKDAFTEINVSFRVGFVILLHKNTIE
ncbi:DUF3575 domain-containing protein [Flammeovirga agarivorans]|uniref:Outer membrane beta-barrel protein n=1 Tax=Flammeovirga agarivorans TaxID=2726742 RepID=A0A7X8XWE9_9BACT|nr:DUF3575 domain-containing protein [Flammeovirga agarivorans]NLR92191.1 outer membrane beta-barrel protein [Flammeovirga agarivorans]